MKRKGRVLLTVLLPALVFTMLSANVFAADPRENTGPCLDPYKGLQAETNFGCTGYITDEDDGYYMRTVVCLKEGEYFRVNDVNMEKGLSKITLTARGDELSRIEIRQEKLKGRYIGEVGINKDSEYKNYSCPTQDAGAKSDFYFVCTMGTCYIDAWKAERKMPTKDQIQAPPEVVNPYKTVETETMENGGGFHEGDIEYSPISENKTLVARNVMFDKGLKGFEITARADYWGDVQMEIFVDDPESAPIAKALIRPRSFETATATALKSVQGLHDVYITANMPVDIDSWKAIPNPPKPPIPPEEPEVTEEPKEPETPETPEQPQIPDVPDEVTEVTEQPKAPETPEGGEAPEASKPRLELTGTMGPCGDNTQLNFKVTNNSDETISDWKVMMSRGDFDVVQSWCVDITEEDYYYVIKPFSWNSKLAPGQSVEFGIIGAGEVTDTMNYMIE